LFEKRSRARAHTHTHKHTHTQVWTISADDGDDLMDEDALLNAEDLKPTPKAADDCEMAEGRKADLLFTKKIKYYIFFFIP